jgi:hypothetical protein
MTTPNPWAEVHQTFAAARAAVREAMNVVAAEHDRQQKINGIGGLTTAQMERDFPLLKGRVGGRS